jgi:Flp pilus assembly protein TadG
MKAKRPQTEKGSSIVEFALVLPLLIALVFGIVEFSIALYDKAMITNASREGARAGIVYRSDPSTGQWSPLTQGEITTIVNNYLSNYLITFGASTTATVQVTPSGVSPGGQLTVQVTYPYTFLVLPNFVLGLAGQINLEAITVMRYE